MSSLGTPEALHSWTTRKRHAKSDVFVILMAESFTPEQIEQFRDAFSGYDDDRDGKITGSEIGPLLRCLGQNPSEAEIHDMLDEVDLEGNGYIGFDEFLYMLNRQMQEGDNEEEVLDAFKLFDRDGDGKITAAELTHILKNLGEPLSQAEVDQ
jgi:calmodulin